MKLYQVPNNSIVRVISTGLEVKFYHIDGMYSFCKTKDKEVIHLIAWEDVEIIEEFT